MDWTVLGTAADVARVASQRILVAAERAIEKHGSFHIVLAGGTTPEKTYELLSLESSDWQHWHVWFGDERCLPRDHPHRNSVMIEKSLTSRVPIPSKQVHIIPAERGPVEAAEYYARLLVAAPPFDMVLLGMGEDGHTASLFPNKIYVRGKTVIPIFDAPKLPAERVSLSAEILSQCTDLLFIITGKSKFEAVSRWQAGEELPVSMIHGIDKTEVLADESVFN